MTGEDKRFFFTLGELRDLFSRAGGGSVLTFALSDRGGRYGHRLEVCCRLGNGDSQPDVLCVREVWGDGRNTREASIPVGSLFDLFPLLDALVLRLSKMRFEGEPEHDLGDVGSDS